MLLTEGIKMKRESIKHFNKSKPKLLEILNDILQSLPILEDTLIEDDIWRFKNLRGYIDTIDFSFFDEPKFSNWQENLIELDNDIVILNLKYYVKFIFLNMASGSQDAHSYKYRLDIFKMLFLFLLESNERSLNKDRLKSFYSLLLTSDINNHHFIQRWSPPAYKSRLVHFNEERLALISRKYKANPLISEDLKGKYSQIRNEACEITLGMTLQDYSDGGSFNFLGLEIGKHYLDHCFNIFQEHGLYASACRATLAQMEKASKDKASYNIERPLIAKILSGVNNTNENMKSKKLETKQKTKKLFAKNYNRLLPNFKSGDVKFINYLLSLLNFPIGFENQEFIRGLLFTLSDDDLIHQVDNQIEGYKSLLEAKGPPLDLTADDIKSVISRELDKEKIEPISTIEICSLHYKNLKPMFRATNAVGTQLLKACFYLVEAAGVTAFVGVTGWRSSEYGFPLSSIQISINPDPLDNNYNPYRFQVKWLVPKTSGNTKIDREIMLGAYLIAKQLNYLNLSGEDAPCLIRSNNDYNTAHIRHRVKEAWFKFPYTYKLFLELDKNKPSKKLKLLSYNQVASLKQVRDDVRKGIDVFNLLNLTLDCHQGIGHKIQAYKRGALNKSEHQLIDKLLSIDTKKAIKSTGTFSRDIINSISNELMESHAYPTPHAFRHMWAEAVLLRYRGDVGKFIRANFKHLDERYFLAYLRDKETNFVIRIAKRRVISSIVREQMSSVRTGRAAYVGGFDRFISKAVHITQILSQGEFEEKVRQIAEQRIVDMKTNAWATCMLRIGTYNSAKCSVNGEPQRYNAAPKFCLGCTNANISEGNFNGIVVYTKGDVDACRQNKLPYFVKIEPLKTVRLALKRIRELNEKSTKNKYIKFINYLEESIEMAKASKGGISHE